MGESHDEGDVGGGRELDGDGLHVGADLVGSP